MKQETEATPLLVELEGDVIFSIEENGDIMLRGKKIGNDKDLMKMFMDQGTALTKCNEVMDKFVDFT